MRHPVIILCLTLFLSSQLAFGQYYNTGQDPASLKWMQIKTSRFTVIYPESYGSGGAIFAQSLDNAYSRLVSLYPEKNFKIPVIIHNYTIESNGYVAWAPKRMELYPTPEQNAVPLENEKQLALHELTHVFQMESLSAGFSKGISLLFGEQISGIIASLIPLWFLEGDAVLMESVLTESGRGRAPSFQKELKAIAVEQSNIYTYDKILNDSYRDYIPDYYQSGYQMVTWSFAKYDLQLWNKVLNYTARKPFTLNPVNISLSRNAGLTKKKLYTESFDSLKTIWTKEISDKKAVTYETLNPSKKRKYINYYSPVFAGFDSIIAVKTSLDKIPQFVLITLSGESEKKIHIPGNMNPWTISYAKGKLVWVERSYDPRWENRSYSIIKLMDIRTNMIKKLSRKSRYMSAALSPDGKMISATENSINNRNSLVLIDANNGFILKTIAAPGNAYLQHPQWAEDGKEITVIYLTDGGEGIMSYSLANQKWKTLLITGRDDLQSAFLRNDSLFYISSHSGTDNIYLQTTDGKITGLTNSKYGTTDLNVKGNRILFSDYSFYGNDLCVVPFNESQENSNLKITSSSFLINRLELKPMPGESTSSNSYTPQRYRKWQHLFKFHSWMPFYADLDQVRSDPSSIRPGVSILSQNTLSTLISTIGYEYSTENKNVFHSRVTWRGLYPVVESQLDYGNNPGIYKLGEAIENPFLIKPGITFTNTVYIPLRFTQGRFFEYLMPSLTSEYRNNYVYIKENGSFDYGQTTFYARLYFSNYSKRTYRDIYPRWAQTIDLYYSFAPFDRLIYGTSGVLKTAFYFPGFFPSNSIKIKLEKEKQQTEKYMFGNKVMFPRGYKNIKSKDIMLLSADYILPLIYPDFNISSILYLKRIRAGLFCDYAVATGNTYYESNASGQIQSYYNDYTEYFRSFGVELLADFHLLRIPYLISGGVQTAWKSFNTTPSFELLLNIDIFGMSIGRRSVYRDN